jgi:hypothetical protein
MVHALAARLYWPGWVVATVLTGLVAGFMLGHALILGRFVDWLLTAGTPAHGLAYPAFRATAGRGGLTAFYAVCGLQVISVVAFLVLALASGRARGAAALAAVAGVLWIVAHYASGFGALERQVVMATGEVPADIQGSFLRLNVPIHVFHAATLTTALGALLAVPRSALRRKD